ncbi:MAG: hypothetical protein RIT27_2199 [Pseudomonadota bacterium]|jgi:hypothetical protein
MKNYLLLFLISGLLVACGPVYETKTNYINPTTDQGKNCALQCEGIRVDCQQTCDENYRNCTNNIRAIQKTEYLQAKNHFLEKKNLCKGKEKDKDCQNLKEPYLNTYVSESECQKNCNCQTNFDRCFGLCGGQITRETKCVSDCE